MSIFELISGLKDIFDRKALTADLRHIVAGIRDLIEGFWNEKRVLERNSRTATDSSPMADELSYRS